MRVYCPFCGMPLLECYTEIKACFARMNANAYIRKLLKQKQFARQKPLKIVGVCKKHLGYAKNRLGYAMYQNG